MLKVLLNGLKPQADSIVAEEQVGFRPGRSTTEQMFNLTILCEKYLQHQDLYHVFEDQWSTIRLYNINTNLIQTTENLNNKATSVVYLNGAIGDWFRTTVEVRQECLISPTLFNVFLERIMTDALEDHQGTVRIENRTNTNLRFADYINGTSINIRINGETLDEVEGLKYLGAVVIDQGSKPEVLSRITQTKAALARLKTISNERYIPLSSKIRLILSLVISVRLNA